MSENRLLTLDMIARELTQLLHDEIRRRHPEGYDIEILSGDVRRATRQAGAGVPPVLHHTSEAERQRMYNHWHSVHAEAVALAPTPPWNHAPPLEVDYARMDDPDQDESDVPSIELDEAFKLLAREKAKP